jgi:hypothetical protein
MSKVVKVSIKPDETQNHIISVTQSGSKVNPVVSFYSSFNGLVWLNVSDVDGKILYKTQVLASAGVNTIEVPAKRLNTFGIKVIQLSMQLDKLNHKFLFK